MSLITEITGMPPVPGLLVEMGSPLLQADLELRSSPSLLPE
jgi:hypothetical protein